MNDVADARAVLERGDAGGLRPTTPGLYVAHVDELEHLGVDGHAYSTHAGDHRWTQFGLGIDQLEPGAGNSYHRELHEDETFVVLDGACDLVVEGELHRIDAGTLVHCPAGTAHLFVGAGDELCRILMIGARGRVPEGGVWGEYLPDPTAARYGLAVDHVTSDPAVAYAGRPEYVPVAPPSRFAIDHSTRSGSCTHGDGANGSARLDVHPEAGGVYPATPGWFILHLDDALWVDDGEVGAARIDGDSPFEQYAVNVRMARPGATMYDTHTEPHFDAWFLVLDGAGTMHVQGEELPLQPGDTVWCPRGTTHGATADDDTHLVMLRVGARDARFERMDPAADRLPGNPAATPPWTWRTR